jgi:hypothetical protein
LLAACALLLVGLLVWGLCAGVPFGSAAATRRTAASAVGRTAPASPATVSASASAACPERFGSYGPGNWPAACWRPYGARSPFNIPIPANPRVERDSSAVVANMISHRWAFQNQHGALTLWGGGSRPVYWARASDPVVRVSCRRSRECPGVTSLHVPQGASADRNSDGHMAVVDQSTHTEYDFWQASGPDHGVITASAASAIPLGPGQGTGLGGRAEASYLGLMGGLLRGQELRAGVINHALVTTVECVEPQDVWPSPSYGRGDLICGGSPAPHLGSLLQLNMSAAEIAASRAPAWQRAVMTAMARYGVYVVDTNGSDDPNMYLLAESDLSYTNFGAAGAMQSFVRSAGGSGGVTGVPLPLSRFRVIEPCVKRGSC